MFPAYGVVGHRVMEQVGAFIVGHWRCVARHLQTLSPLCPPKILFSFSAPSATMVILANESFASSVFFFIRL